MKNISLLVLFLLLPDLILACPGCAGSTDNAADNNTVYVLMGFIALIYIPFFFLYRTIIKYRNINKVERS